MRSPGEPDASPNETSLAQSRGLPARAAGPDSLLSSTAALLRQLLADSPDLIYLKDLHSRFIAVSAAVARRHGTSTDELIGRSERDLCSAEKACPEHEDDLTILRTGEGVVNRLDRETEADGSFRWIQTTKLPLRDPSGAVVGLMCISRDVTNSVVAEKNLEALQQQLLEATRQAGMAEVATGVLHNVGNVLTSINVTANLLVDRLRDSKVTSLSKVCALLRENAADLPGFFANDPRAGKLTSYLENLNATLEKERQESMSDLGTLLKSVGHVKDIIWMQQDYASVSGLVEPLNAPETIEDALKLSNNALLRHNVQVVRDFNDAGRARAERHKVLQILVNLIGNAKKAMDAKEPSQRRLVIRTETAVDGSLLIKVSDNGIGIPPENLGKIFSHGFTTRKDGHGFGLHSSALAATQMGGSLTVESAGTGKGATFTLTLPAWKEDGAQGKG